DPDRIDAEFLEPALLQFFRQAREVAAVPGADFLLAILLPAVGIVVARITVEEAVRHDEVHDRVVGKRTRHRLRARSDTKRANPARYDASKQAGERLVG